MSEVEVPAIATGGGEPRVTASWISRALDRLPRTAGLLLAVALVVLIFAVLSGGSFLTPANLLGLLRYASSIAIIGFGLTALIIVGEIDISFGNVYGFTVMLCAVSWIAWGWPLWLAIIAAFVAAILIGCFNAFFTAVVKVPSFITTLGSSALIFGLTLLISNTARYSPVYPPSGLEPPPQGEIDALHALVFQDLPGGIPMQVIWMFALAFVFWILLQRSLFGFRLKAIGGNATAARLARLPVTRYKFFAFILVAAAATMAGLLDFAYVSDAVPDAGQSMLFPTFTAVIIGGASLQGGYGTVQGTLIGALLLGIIFNGLAVIAAGPFAQQALLGLVTIGAVALDVISRRRRGTV